MLDTLRRLFRVRQRHPPRPGESQWCLVGNVAGGPPGRDAEEDSRGTKHFAPNTKVYCLPAQWGDGFENIIVIGRHRGSKRFTTMVIQSKWVTNWRAKVVYDTEVLRRLQQPSREFPSRNWKSREDVEAYVTMPEERRQVRDGKEGL